MSETVSIKIPGLIYHLGMITDQW